MRFPLFTSDKIKEKISRFFSHDQIETLARQSGFVQRKSSLSGHSFLLLSMFDHHSHNRCSLNGLCTSLMDYGVAISKQSLHARFNDRSVTFLRLITSKLLTMRLAPFSSSLKGLNFCKRILILDSTSFQLPDCYSTTYKGWGGDASEAGIKVHLCYNLKAMGELDFEIQSAATSDKQNAIMYNDIRPGDLRIEDLGYCRFDRLNHINSVGAFYLSRLAANTMIYIKSGKEIKELDICTIIEKLKPGEIKEYNVLVSRTHQLPSRLILEKLPAEIVNEKMRKFKERQAHRHRKIRQKSLLFKTVNAYVTNVPACELPKEKVRKIYALRWQIELIFKTWKSYYHIDKVKETKMQRFESYFYGKLILILLHMKLYQVFKQWFWNKCNTELSEIKALQALIASSYKLKALLIYGGKMYPDLLGSLFTTMNNYCIKEKKTHRLRPIDLVHNSFC
jgi:hypothetical protein